MTLDLLGAFTIGLLGAGHCMGMCGGIASLLSIGQPNKTPTTLIVNYNLGRLISYALIGSVVGGTIAGIASLSQFNHALAILRIIAAAFMVLLAFYVGRWWNGLLIVEKLGQSLWKRISPFANQLLPLKHSSYAIPFGFLWGWLPCGLVYSTLTWAAVSGSALGGGATMLAFGLGTLPAMLLVGTSATKLKNLQNSLIFRNVAAISILVYGLYTGYESVMIFNAN
ncbi:cytochrome biogenesis protein [Vibrio mediterranei]|uniref:sulfite exporter TauE/SafE family protein n=1 Tax=Vibrio mediterranei TaxID=689 RepID=UPI000D182C8A|nr:sulfite exporter TauE/SafE family protein [Vibrio mediterranei]MCG9660957.1 sulfite exporter TauE/SafE family protein [Vibrio mediterranei]PTC04186.1 cytochrome biogenesis protein [Vibrio mediterranei]